LGVATVAGVLAAGLASPFAAEARVRSCSASHLSTWAGPTTAGAGHILAEFAFVNRGSSRCSLTGNPRIQMLDANGHLIHTVDLKSFPGALGIRRKTVVLTKGRRAYFGVYYANKTGFGSLVCPTSAKLRLRLPGRQDSLVLSGPGAAIAPYGGGGSGQPCGAFEVTPVTKSRFQ
jgi:hypothetical protein